MFDRAHLLIPRAGIVDILGRAAPCYVHTIVHIIGVDVSFEWDEQKRRENLRKHEIELADAVFVFEDELAMTMRRNYDFSKARRGPVVAPEPGKTRITIRLDDDILGWFRDQANAAGGGNYQTMINNALREHVKHQTEPLERTLRRVIREELKRRGAA